MLELMMVLWNAQLRVWCFLLIVVDLTGDIFNWLRIASQLIQRVTKTTKFVPKSYL